MFVLLVALQGAARADDVEESFWPADGRALCTAPSQQNYPNIVPDGSGGAIITWYDDRSGNYDIYAQHVLTTGKVDSLWPANGVALCLAPKDQTYPSIIADGAGGAIVAWQDARAGISDYDIYAQHVLASGTVDPAWPVDGIGLCSASGSQFYPAVVGDGAGGAIVAWLDNRGPDADLYAQRVRANGTVGPTWPIDGRAVCNAPDDQMNPGVVTDGAGGAILAWMDRRSGEVYDIYAQRVLADGRLGLGWPANGRALCTAFGNQFSPTLAIDGAGGAIVAWYDFRRDSSDIFAQHVRADGEVDPAWPVDGQALCKAGNDQAYPTIVSDDKGGAIVVWHDFRSDQGTDIYAQRVLATGEVDPGWPVDGAIVCDAPNNQYYPTTTSDGANGAIVTWYDYRDGTADVYVEHLFKDGVTDGAWPANGRALCTASRDQTFPTLVSDGSGGAIITWQDGRSGSNDIYARRVYSSGGITPVGNGPRPKSFSMLPPYPNPASDEPVRVRFRLPSAQRVSVQVLDLSGHRVRVLEPGREFASGAQSLTWDGRDQEGRVLKGGVYFIQIRTASASETRRVALIH